MKKFTWIAVVLVVALGALVLPAAAQDEADLLAQYFPTGTPLYIEFRTDDATLGQLDALVSKIAGMIPDSNMSGTLMEALDEGIAEMVPGGSFGETIRPWLGDWAAFGVTAFDAENMNNSDENIMVVVSITDQAGAEAFFAQAPSMDEYTVDDGNGYTLYSPEEDDRGNPYLVFRSDVVILTSNAALAETGGSLDGSLSGSAGFSAALGALPEAGYHASAYIDTPALLDAAMQTNNLGPDEIAMIEPLTTALQPQAIGFTLLDDRSLVMDVASPYIAGDDFPLTMGETTPIDPAFAQYIPANTPLVIHSSNLYGTYQAGLENLRTLAEMMSENNDDFDPQQLQMVTFGINFAVQGLTGMSTANALGWMTGDYAFAVGMTPSFADSRSIMAAAEALPIDFALILEVTDAAAAGALFAGLSDSLSEMDADNVSVEVTDEAINVTLTPEDSPFPIELTIAHNDVVFVVGTERMVRAALDPQDGLDNDANFTTASGYFLDGANTVLYIGSDALTPLTRVMINDGNPSNIQESGKQIKMVLGLFDSVSISSTTLPENSGSVARFVWTLPE